MSQFKSLGASRPRGPAGRSPSVPVRLVQLGRLPLARASVCIGVWSRSKPGVHRCCCLCVNHFLQVEAPGSSECRRDRGGALSPVSREGDSGVLAGGGAGAPRACAPKCRPGPGAGNRRRDGLALSALCRETEEGAPVLPRSPHHAPAGPRRHRQGAQGQVPFHGTAGDGDPAQVPLRPAGGPRRAGVQIPGEQPIAGRATVGSSGRRGGLWGRSLESSSLSLRHCSHCGGRASPGGAHLVLRVPTARL